MAKKTKFKPEWKFKLGTHIMVPELEIIPGYTSPMFVGRIAHCNVYSRSNCRYVCKNLQTGQFQEWDKVHMERYGDVIDIKLARLLYLKDEA